MCARARTIDRMLPGCRPSPYGEVQGLSGRFLSTNSAHWRAFGRKHDGQHRSIVARPRTRRPFMSDDAVVATTVVLSTKKKNIFYYRKDHFCPLTDNGRVYRLYCVSSTIRSMCNLVLYMYNMLRYVLYYIIYTITVIFIRVSV